MLDHLFGDINIGDDTISERADRLDIMRRFAHHELCLIAGGLDASGAVNCLQRNDGRFIQHNATVTDMDDRIHRAKVDGHVLGRGGEYAGHFHVRNITFLGLFWDLSHLGMIISA